MRVRKAVFPMGGLGTRFLPATKALPKEMLPIVDKPLIQYAVEEAHAAGIEEFIFVTSPGKTAIKEHFDRSLEIENQLSARNMVEALNTLKAIIPDPGQIAYAQQREPLGLGHAVWCARNFVGNEPFAVLLPDDLIKSQKPCLKQMTEAATLTGGNVVAVMDVPRANTSLYGVLEVGYDDGQLAEVLGLVEKPDPASAPSTLSIIGRYILMPEVFNFLDLKERGTGGEIQLTDAMSKMIGSHPFHGLRFEGKRFDCGAKLGFLEATIAFGLDRDDLREDLHNYLRIVMDNT